MNLENETFRFILKEYLRGNKDNIGFILMSLRNIILDRIILYNKLDEVDNIVYLLIDAINNFTYEKSMTFTDYINLYLDIILKNDIKQVDKKIENDFISLYIDSIKTSINEQKVIKFTQNTCI